ncbi:response regulator [Salinimicrobium gaetbulicola]|uniref:histidine kinase n=1 Tax=Salinimicrobium gaetbulicola TaxID=999702 RepID=A0ABW3IDP7_9FLAO
MKKNYFLSFIVVLLWLPGFSQTPAKAYKDSIQKLRKAAGEAYSAYDYNASIEYSAQLVRLASKFDDPSALFDGYNGLGISYEVLEDTLRAKENYEKALHYAELTQNDTLLGYAYNNLGNILSSQEKTVNDGLEYYKKAVGIALRLNDPNESLTPIINIAWTYLDNDNYDAAAPYLKKAWKLSSKSNNKSLQSNLLSLIGMYHSGKQEYDEARDHFQLALEVAEKDTLIVDASFAYKEYAEMLVKTGAYKEAYSALEKHQKYREKFFQKEKNLQREAVYGRFKTEFETEEYKKDLAAAQREQKYKDAVLAKTKQITAIMVFSLLVMLLFLILLYRNNRLRKTLIQELKNKNQEYMEAKEEAERLSLLKTRFFSTVSHELRTPLYGVVGLTSLLLEDNKDEKQKEDLKSLKFSADYLLALINDVLQMNKMESNLLQLENSSFNIEELFHGIVQSFKTTRNLNNNKIELRIDSNIPRHLIGDSMRLSQIMMNLVGNAVKFTENGKVWIKASCKQCSDGSCLIYFEVGDTGPGIPDDKQQEIFEEFSQLKSTNYNYQGTGLGLPIVKKLLQLFGSEIKLKSASGEGAIFSFEISFLKGDEKSMPVIKKTALLETEQDEVRKALIVDDNRINQVVTKRILEQRDFECDVAGSGEEAIAYLKLNRVDVVLMDVNMPGMDGMQATMEIRKFDPYVPVIALTAVEVGEMRDEILGAGMNDIINKPYNIPQFFQIIFKNLRQPVVDLE